MYAYSVSYYTVLKEKNDEYCDKVKTRHSNDKTLFELAWTVKELSQLNEEGRLLHVESTVLSEKIGNPSYDKVQDNFVHRLSHYRERLSSFVKSVTRFRRVAATHILIIMISTEERKQKPYAMPVQCLPYVGLQDMEVRKIVDKVIQEMVNRGMKVSGEF